MIDWAQLSADEQHTFWMTKAQEAIDSFSLAPADVNDFSYTHNAVFHIQSANRHFILRLSPTDSLSLSLIHAQLRWLNGLPDAIAIQRGAFTMPESCTRHLNGDIPVIATLLSYLEGDVLTSDMLNPGVMVQIAQWLAELHQASPITPEIGLPSLGYEGLFGEQGRYAIAPDTFNSEQERILTEALARVQSAMQRLDALGAIDKPVQGYLHGDLLTKNILCDKNGCILGIDTEYAGWGYFLYDLTPLLWQLKPDSRYQELASAFWGAYQSAMNYPIGTVTLLEALIAGRQIASLRWLSLNRHNPAIAGRYDGIVNQRLVELARFSQSGTLIRQG